MCQCGGILISAQLRRPCNVYNVTMSLRFAHADLVDPASDVSPDSYPSSDGGGSFQLMKAEEGRVKEEKKKSRKYRGATEEILEGMCSFGVGLSPT